MAKSGAHIERGANRKSIVFHSTLSAVITPLLIVVVVGVATTLRLRAEETSLGLARAKLSCLHIGRALMNAPNKPPKEIVDSAQTKLGVRAGVYFLGERRAHSVELGNLKSRDLVEIETRSPTKMRFQGSPHAVSVCRLPDIEKSFVTALVDLEEMKTAALPGTVRFLSIAILVVLAAGLFGIAKGSEISDYFSALGARLGALFSHSPSNEQNPVSILPGAQVAQNDLERALVLVEESFKGELALYRDAVDEVETMDAKRTAFLGGLSSDLHSPLLHIRDHARDLMDGKDGPLAETQAEDVRIILKASDRLNRIVEDVLDLSSLIQEGIIFDDEPVFLVDVAEEVIETAKGGLGKKPLTLNVDCEEGPSPMVRGSRQRLWQILTNLVSNAIKFTESGKVTVRLGRRTQRKVFVEVSDTGIGIKPEFEKELFDPFKQQGELSKKMGGTGLGLAICKRLVDLHGGEIEVVSNEGGGLPVHCDTPGGRMSLDRQKAIKGGLPPGIRIYLFTVFGIAGLLGGTLGVGVHVDPAVQLCLFGSAAITFCVQLAVANRLLLGLNSRITEPHTGKTHDTETLVKSFPVYATLRVGVATVLTAAFFLTAISTVLRIEPRVLLQSAQWVFLCQFVLLLPVHSAMKRCGLHIGNTKGFFFGELKESSVLGTFLFSNMAAAAIAGLMLHVAGNHAIEMTAKRWHSTGDSRELAAIMQAISKSPSMDLIFGLLVIASALLVSALMSLRQGTRVQREMDFLLKRAQGFALRSPDHKNAALSKEVVYLSRTLNQIETRYFAMKQSDSDAIQSGTSARELKAEFFAGMSHDLRSPLNSIIGFTDLLLKGMEGALLEPQTQRIGIISAEAKKLMILISDILDTSKLEAGQLEIERTWVPAVELLTESATETEALIGTRPVVLKTSIVPGLPPLFVDKTRMRQALLSLVSRIVDAMERGTITMSAKVERDHAGTAARFRLDLLDTARSITRSKRRIIKRAYLATERVTTSSEAGSLGLGMALAREIVRLHNGTLEVFSLNRREVIFSMILPLDETV